MYNEEIGPPLPLASAALPGEDHGLWNGTGPFESVVNEVLAAPLGGAEGESACGSWVTSTRLLGQGMLWAESSGREGEVRMKGGPLLSSDFFGLRRKVNMLAGEAGAEAAGYQGEGRKRLMGRRKERRKGERPATTSGRMKEIVTE